MINSRKEPSTVVFLRRLVLIITALMFSILSVETALKINFYKSYETLSSLRNSMEEISMNLMHIHSGFRTLINIHNGIQKDEIVGLVSEGEFSKEILSKMNGYLNMLNINKNVFLIISSPEEVEKLY